MKVPYPAPTSQKDQHGHTPAFYVRLGRFVTTGGYSVAPDMLMSRAIQICGTWRTHFAWHLTQSLRRAGA